MGNGSFLVFEDDKEKKGLIFGPPKQKFVERDIPWEYVILQIKAANANYKQTPYKSKKKKT